MRCSALQCVVVPMTDLLLQRCSVGLLHQHGPNPQTKKIRLKIITTAKNSSSFHGSPRDFQTSSYGSPRNFKQVFTGVNGSPRNSKEWTGKLCKLEMQIFQV